MSRRTLTTLSIPVVSGLYGPIHTGSLVLVEAGLEAAPNLLLASIVREAIRKGAVGIVFYRDYSSDYLTLFESLGIPVASLVKDGRLEIAEALDTDAFAERIAAMVSRLGTVVAYALGLDALDGDKVLELIGGLRETSSVLYLVVCPKAADGGLFTLERLSDAVFRAVVEETDKGYSRYLVMVYSKRRARPDIKVHYAVSSRGLSFEALSHM